MKKNKKILLTGGGTAGHVMPHLALLPSLKKRGWDILYVGSRGMEKRLVEEQRVPFQAISVGKLRRYFSWQNLLDFGRIILGFFQSLKILGREKPDVIFSKGGFVSVPVAVAAWCLRIPVITHESDLTPGLANRIIAKFSRKILCAFPETLKFLPLNKAEAVGIPIRTELAQGERSAGLKLCSFSEEDKRPIVLVMGGSLGALRLNEKIHAALPLLLKEYRVIHLTGEGKQKLMEEAKGSYKAFEFAGEELKELLACTDMVISRAGANAIFELLHLKKPMILVPLEVGTRGDQVDNALTFERHNCASVLREKDLSPTALMAALKLSPKKNETGERTLLGHVDPTEKICYILDTFASKQERTSCLK
ncbi:MAG: undecaprenyldiphospho-muramoylpentapeptide beta-N-acetylglucosaminyltransferase [Deltaproteobacteria bacterium]|nr:undecaprenyldiphospho-muramoylpentapeptide beta-N-acetylglucosaminyltransferase [Deltaproteobacteria bacterium]